MHRTELGGSVQSVQVSHLIDGAGQVGEVAAWGLPVTPLGGWSQVQGLRLCFLTSTVSFTTKNVPDIKKEL